MKHIFAAAGILLSAIGLTAASGAQAQTYPDKTVRLILPAGAGGPTDLVARVLAEGLKQLWKVSVIVENRPGAGGNIGAEAVAKADPDGYTLLLTNVGTMVANQAIYSNIGFNSLTDFAPISLLVESPTFVYVHKDLPAKSLAELVELAKKQPGKLNYADSGLGTLPGLGAELLKFQAKIDLTRISFRDGAQILGSIDTRQFDVYFTGIEFLAQIKPGDMRPLAVASRQRHPSLPAVPTMAEAGMPNFNLSGWYGLLAPAKTPPAILALLERDAIRALQLPELKAKLEGMGLFLTLTNSSDFGQRIKTERAQWDEVIKAAGIKAN